MIGHMAEIRDAVVDGACKVAQSFDVLVEGILIREYFEPYEDEHNKIVFDVRVSSDDKTGHAYWGAVIDAVWDNRDKLSKKAQTALDNISVFVKW